MKLNHFPGQFTRRSNICFASILCLCLLLASCGRPDEPVNSTLGKSVPTPTVTSVTVTTVAAISPTDQPSDTTKFTDEEQRQRDLATVEAGGELPTPVETPNAWESEQLTAAAQGVFPTPAPRPTPVLGISGQCADASREFDYGDCWAGQIDGQYVFVETGAPSDHPAQGVVRIYTTTLDRKIVSAKQTYPTPTPAGLVYIAQVMWPRFTLVTLNDDSTVTRFVFNGATRIWEQPGACELYPIAVHTSTLNGLQVRHEVADILNGAGTGNFGWLAWNDDQGNSRLVQSLIAPGASTSYTNPATPGDHLLNVGDEVRGRTGVDNSAEVRQALDGLVEHGDLIVAPVWDQAAGQGSNLRYHIAGFAWVRLTSYQLPGQNRISVQYFGKATCGA